MGVEMNFDFRIASRIIFGSGSIEKVGALAASFGKRALLIAGAPKGITEIVQVRLEEAGLVTSQIRVTEEPSVESIYHAVQVGHEAEVDLVIGVGGGSAMDTGKAVSVLMTNKGDILNYLEVVGKGQALQNPGLPIIAVPTTAGTGSEVTSNAVIGVGVNNQRSDKVKVSLRSSFMSPRLAVIDPQLTIDLSPTITAFSGLDALTQLIEPFVSKRANYMTDLLCREGIRLIALSLRKAFHHGDDLSAREDMSLASLLSGIALANAKLGAVHGFAAPIGGKYQAPHGAICARLLPIVMESNWHALTDRQPGDLALDRYREIAKILRGDINAEFEDGLSWVKEICQEFAIPPLSHYGLRREDFSELILQAEQASSMQGNPIQLTRDELHNILTLAM